MNFKIGDSIDNYDDLRKLPEGTVLTAVGNLTSGERILETRDGELGLWDKKDAIRLSCDEGVGKFSGTLHYIIKELPEKGLTLDQYLIKELQDTADETEGTANELEAFKVRVIEVATRYAKAYELCDAVDDALEELGLFRSQKRQVTFTVALDVELPRSIEPNGFNSTQAVFQDLEENLHDAVKEALVAEAKLHGISVENITVK